MITLVRPVLNSQKVNVLNAFVLPIVINITYLLYFVLILLFFTIEK